MSKEEKLLKILFQHLDDDDSHARIVNMSCTHKSVVFKKDFRMMFQN